MSEHKWIRVDERTPTPEEGEHVAMLFLADRVPGLYAGYYDAGGRWRLRDEQGDFEAMAPTHWQPLGPLPPAGDRKALRKMAIAHAKGDDHDE